MKKISKAHVVYLVDFKQFIVIFRDPTKCGLVGFSKALKKCKVSDKEKTIIKEAILDIQNAGYETSKGIQVRIFDFCFD